LISSSELESFLLKHKQDRFLQLSESERMEDCRLWLCRLMKGQRRPKGVIKSEAKKRFAVTGRRFDKIWKEAVALTGSAGRAGDA
jgi:hypothetical protein